MSSCPESLRIGDARESEILRQDVKLFDHLVEKAEFAAQRFTQLGCQGVREIHDHDDQFEDDSPHWQDPERGPEIARDAVASVPIHPGFP